MSKPKVFILKTTEKHIKDLIKSTAETTVNTFWSRIAHMQNPDDIDEILRIKNQVIKEI